MSQTAIPTFPAPKGYVGAMSDMGVPHDIWSRTNGESSAEIPFGAMVCLHTAGTDKAKLPDAEDVILLGFVRHSHAYAKDTELGSVGVKPKCGLNVVRTGRMWVLCETDVTEADRLYVRFAGTGDKGALTKTPVAGETIDVTGQVSVVRGATAGNLVEININMNALS